MPTHQAWARLAELLTQQRGRIDSNAKRFANTTGLNYRMVYDIEHAKRDNYRPAKLGEIERAYRLRTGAIRDFLDGKTPTLETDEDRDPPPSSEPENAPRSGRYRPVQVPEGLDPDDPDVQRIQGMKLPPKRKYMFLLQLLEVIEENEEDNTEEPRGRHAG